MEERCRSVTENGDVLNWCGHAEVDVNSFYLKVLLESVFPVLTSNARFYQIQVVKLATLQRDVTHEVANLRLKPPKATLNSIIECWLTQTVPASSLWAIVRAFETSFEKTAAARPKQESLASLSSSSSVLYLATTTTKTEPRQNIFIRTTGETNLVRRFPL